MHPRFTSPDSADKQRAVSTVVGVGLAVAVLIVAALVWGFVLDGGQAGTGTDASFSGAERVLYVQSDEDGKTARGNITYVNVTHDGGDRLPVSQTQLALDGNTSVWELENPGSEDIPTNGWNYARPSPNVCNTTGGREAFFESGQTLGVLAAGGNYTTGELDDGGKDKYRLPALPSDANLLRGYDTSVANDDTGADETFTFTWDCSVGPWKAQPEYTSPRINLAATNVSGETKNPTSFANVPMAGDEVEILWESASGEETETVFTYTVQTDSPIVANDV